MFKNRFILILAALSMLLVTLAVSQPFSEPPKPVVVPLAGAADPPNVMDSATRSYIAWGEALEKAKLNALDSGTRSYIAWGEALEAAGKLGESGTCSNMTQEYTFAGIDNSLDSATRSYIAWGLALQAKNDLGALCR
jgi:hypothetical protein